METYETARKQCHGQEHLAWASMIYACVDQPQPDYPAPPNWERTVEQAPEGYWDERGSPPETYASDGVLMMRGKPGGCGFQEVRLLCVGVEHPVKLNGPAVGYPEMYVPSPMIAGACPHCDLPMSHAFWGSDKEWWPPHEVPEGAPHFRLPTAEEALGLAAHGYGGALFVPTVHDSRTFKGGG